MKKLAKILVLFLVVSALAGALVLVASAEAAEPAAFTPASGTTFAVWVSEEAYERGDAPTEYTVNSLNTFMENYKNAPSTPIERRTAYIEFYTDISVGNYNVYYLDFVVNCNGNKFTVGALDLRYSDMTVMNGTYEHTKQLDIQYDSEVLYKNLTHNVVYNANGTGTEAFINFSYNTSSENSLTWDNCVINWKYDTDYIRAVGSALNKDYAEIKFIDTDILVSGNNPNLIKITEFAAVNGYDAKVKIVFDSKSSVQGNVSSYVLLNENFTNNQIGGFTDNPQYVIFEEGFSCTAGAVPTLEYAIKKYNSSGVLQPVEYVDGFDGADCKVWFVKPGTTTPLEGQFYAVSSDDGLFALSEELPENVGWYTYIDEEPAFTMATVPEYNDKGEALFKVANIKSFVQGSTIVFVRNVNMWDASSSAEFNNYKSDLTFDLNGNTIFVYNRWRVSLYDNGVYYTVNLTVKNGTVDASALNDYIFDGNSKGGIIRFENLTINGSKTASNAIKRHEGTLIMKKCVINTPNRAFTFSESSDITLDFDNVTINAKNGIATRVYAGKQTVMSFKDCTFNVTDTAFTVEVTGTPSNEDTVIINLDGCNVTAPKYQVYNYSGNNLLRPKKTVILNVSDTYFSRSIAYPESFTLNVAEGEKAMNITGKSGYTLYVGEVPVDANALQANLTLYTDFSLNIYANSTISSIKYNGALLEHVAQDGVKVYTINGITPNTAAEALNFTVYTTVDGITYEIPLSYSVLDYANAVIGSSTINDAGKKLVSAAMAYVQAAYTYTGKEAPEFKGVAFDEAVAPTVADITLPSSIGGVKLALDTGFKLRFTLKEGANADLTVAGSTYEVRDGLVGNANYIDVELRAYALYNSAITISDGTVTGNYVFASYVNYVNGLKGEEYNTLKDFINALYTFTYYAREYKNANAM